MSAPQPYTESLTAAQAAVLLRQVTLSQAAELARGGNYAAAEELLSGVMATEKLDVGALDLFARIRAQQGSLHDAESLWQQVLRLDPKHPGAQAGLIRIQRMRRHPIWLQTVWPLLVGVGVLLIVALGLIWRANRQASANAALQQHVAEIVGSRTQFDGQQIQSLLTGIESLKNAQTQAAENLTKFGAFSLNLDGWTAAQTAVAAQLTEIQAAAKRSIAQQESQAQASSNQVDTLGRALDQELAAAKASLEHQITILQADGKSLAARHETSTQTISNQINALDLAINREHAMASEIEKRRATNEKLQADYRSLVAEHEQLLIQAGIMTNVPAVLIESPGVKTAIAGKSLVLSFEDGLFDHGAHLRIGAKDRLAAILKTLAQSREPLAIEVVGYSDGDQGFFGPVDSYSLGLKRASTVLDFIRVSTLFAPSQLRASSGGSSQLPFPSDTETKGSRNRTVVLKISRGEK